MAVSTHLRSKIREIFGTSPQRVTAEARRAGISTAEWYEAQLPVARALAEDKKKAARRERDSANRERINETARRNYARRRDAAKEAVERFQHALNEKRARETAERRTAAKGRVEVRRRRKEDAASTIQRAWRNAMLKRAVHIDRVPELVERKFIDSPHTPFVLTMKSAANPQLKTILTFKNAYHFHNWVLQRDGKIFDQGSAEATKGSAGMVITWDSGPEDGALFGYVHYTAEPIAGGDSNDRKPSRVIKCHSYTITIAQTRSQLNNCGLQCVARLLNLTVTPLQMRKAHGLKTGEQLTIPELMAVYKTYAPADARPLRVHTIDTEHIDMEGEANIYHNQKHFSVITDAVHTPPQRTPKKRGLLFWDIETRAVDKKSAYSTIKGGGKLYHIQDAITHAVYRCYKSDEWQSISFETNDDASSVRQFADWLRGQHFDGKHYHCYAHNGSNFDLLFYVASLEAKDRKWYTPTMRGSSIIKLEHNGHIFLDTCCFMPSSLERLSTDYKVEVPKLSELVVDGRPLTSKQICFYKPHLPLREFMQLKHSEPEFWAAYNEYCRVDCIALSQVWLKFQANADTLTERFAEASPMHKNDIMSRACLRQSCTVGGHAQKILNALNGVKNTRLMLNAYKRYSLFLDGDAEKHAFVMGHFKRGGISHCNQMGKHLSGISSVDVTSQYPTAMMNMRIPSGHSKWVTEYDATAHGFYELEDLHFDTELRFKPVCTVGDNGVLNWSTGKAIDKLHADSYMIRYLQQHFGLVSFKVVKGLVSKYDVEGSELFGKYVSVLFAEKAKQDELKDAKSPEYNPSYRETVKLYLNAVTGKLVMDREKYAGLKSVSEEDLKTIDPKDIQDINGVKYLREKAEDSLNQWVVAGVMVYSYSKRQLFDYIRCLPGNSDSVIHVETDSIYFSKRLLPAFKENLARYEGEYGCKFGSELGSVKVEMDTPMPAYFLNKKFYCVFDHSKRDKDGKPKPDFKCISKGIPSVTILDDGTDKQLLDVSIYERVFAHQPGDAPITVTFASLSRRLHGLASIRAVEQTRTINSLHCYSTYE